MGKSVLTDQARRLGIPVHDADACVHELMQAGGDAFLEIEQAFPSAIIKGKIDRQKLGVIIFKNDEKRALLESILHPLVRKKSENFIRLSRKARHPFCILDIPLLFETGRDKDMDIVVTVSAPRAIQKRRVLSRSNMTLEKFQSILKTQTPDAEKRLRSDITILSSRGRRHTLSCLKHLKETYK